MANERLTKAAHLGSPHTVAQAMHPDGTQKVALSGTSAQSEALSGTTRLVRLCASGACYIKFGANPTATSSDMYLPANSPEYFVADGGEKIAALQAESGGNLFITEAG